MLRVLLVDAINEFGWSGGTVGVTQFVDFRIGEGEGGGAEQAEEGEIVRGIGDGGEDVEQVADFGAVVEAASRDGDEGDVCRFERVFVNGVSGGGAEEQSHVAPREAFGLVKFAQAVGKSLGGGGASLFGGFAKSEMEFDEGRLDVFADRSLAIGA